MLDRSLNGLLALLDRAKEDLAEQYLVGGKLFKLIYKDKKPDHRGAFLKSAWVPTGEGEKELVVYRFGWSTYRRELTKSYSRDFFTSPHTERCLKKHNPEDLRLKQAPPEPEGPMDKLAWLKAEENPKVGLAKAEKVWEARWQKEMGFDQDLMAAFHAHTQRQQQLFYREGFVLSKLSEAVRGHLAAKDQDIWQVRQDTLYGGEKMGPDVRIAGRTFFFQGECLQEGPPWPCFEFDGTEEPLPNERAYWYGPEAQGRHALKTSELRDYLHKKARRR